MSSTINNSQERRYESHTPTTCPTTAKLNYLEKTVETHDTKIDKLIEIASDLKKMEERSINQHALLERLVSRADNAEGRIEEIEERYANMSGGMKAVQWLGATLLTLLAAIGGFMFDKGIS